jgi:putative transposase
VNGVNRINREVDTVREDYLMTEYSRAWVPGGTWFFTVNLAGRKKNRLLIDRIDLQKSAFREIRLRRSFRIVAIVIFPDHLHCIWTLPPCDTDFSSRWNLIKSRFSRGIEKGERISESRSRRGERGIWQRTIFGAPHTKLLSNR